MSESCQNETPGGGETGEREGGKRLQYVEALVCAFVKACLVLFTATLRESFPF